VKGSTIVLGVCLSLCLVTVVAETYRWVDAQGRVHYGDRPPAGTTTQTIGFTDNHGSQAQPGLREGEVQMLRSAGERPTRSARATASVATSDGAVASRQDSCDQARRDLAQVRSEMRAGYKASRYEALRQRERQAKRDKREHCR